RPPRLLQHLGLGGSGARDLRGAADERQARRLPPRRPPLPAPPRDLPPPREPGLARVRPPARGAPEEETPRRVVAVKKGPGRSVESTNRTSRRRGRIGGIAHTPEEGMDYEQIRFEIEDGVATITLHRPEALNAFTARMGAEWGDALARCDEDDDVRAVILTGAGRAFCAG